MASQYAPQSGSIREFEARTAAIIVGDDSDVEDIESFGYDLSKGHELQYTVDQRAVWVKGVPEITGSFVLKASSPSISAAESLWLDDEVFDLAVQLSSNALGGENDSGNEQINVIGCMITDISHSDYQIDDMPTITFDWQGVNVDTPGASG